MHVAIVTAGGAGMFCGSCLHDNAWARALRDAGVEVTLLPFYTPIRVDDENLTSTPIFFGGINVYLDHYVPGWRRLPRRLTRWLDAPWLLKAVSQRGVSNDARQLGELTVEMLRGSNGPQASEGAQFVRFLAREIRPDIVVFSNVMLCGEVARLKAEFRGPVLCTLQGDDVFLDALIEPYRSQAFQELRGIVSQLDGFLVHSRFYAAFMQEYLQIPPEKVHRLPLAIDCRGHTGQPRPIGRPPTIGYFARLAPEKGLRELVEAAVVLNRRRQDFRVVAGGYLLGHQRTYYEEVLELAAPLGDRFQYRGSPDRLAEKVALYSTFDVFSAPAPYREPKGLYVLEALANGVPVVQPGHGHFPELVEETGGGICVEPRNPAALADGLERLLSDEPLRLAAAQRGREQVLARHALPAIADATIALFSQLCR